MGLDFFLLDSIFVASAPNREPQKSHVILSLLICNDINPSAVCDELDRLKHEFNLQIIALKEIYVWPKSNRRYQDASGMLTTHTLIAEYPATSKRWPIKAIIL
jgi:hypothetical protein